MRRMAVQRAMPSNALEPRRRGTCVAPAFPSAHVTSAAPLDERGEQRADEPNVNPACAMRNADAGTTGSRVTPKFRKTSARTEGSLRSRVRA